MGTGSVYFFTEPAVFLKTPLTDTQTNLNFTRINYSNKLRLIRITVDLFENNRYNKSGWCDSSVSRI